MELMIDNRELNIKNADKVYFSQRGTIKAEVIEYYINMWRYIEPHLKNRPFSMIFFPGGKVEDSFYQKQCPTDAPKWVKTAKVSSKKGSIDWILVNDLSTMVYLANKSVAEAHCWFSRFDDRIGEDSLHHPDLAVIDIDPNGSTAFKEAVIIAQRYNDVLKDFGLQFTPKTSGGRGIHLFLALKEGHSFEDVQIFLRSISSVVQQSLPEICTQERLKSKRGDKVYLDAVQCNYGKTLAMPYSLRVKNGGLVSTPLRWEELNFTLNPQDFNIDTISKRINKKGDIMEDFYLNQQSLPLFN